MKDKEESGEEEMEMGDLNMEELEATCERKEFSSIPDQQISLLKYSLVKIQRKPKPGKKK